MNNWLGYEDALDIKLGSKVVCPERNEDIHYGWDDDMDDMLGLVLPVADKQVFDDEELVGISLIHPVNQGVYTFDHWVLVRAEDRGMVPNKKAKVEYNGHIYITKENLAVRKFKHAIEKDRIAFQEHVLGPGVDSAPFSEEMLMAIKKRCPRLLGYALSHNIIIREKV